MTLAVLKTGRQWDFLAKTFSLKGPTFERMALKFRDIISDPVFEHYVEYKCKNWNIELMSGKKIGFKKYRIARYATDVTFQRHFRPSGSV